MEQMPCQYCGRYYGHSVACFSNSIVSSAERAIFSEISRQHNNLLYDCEKEIDSLKTQLREAEKALTEIRNLDWGTDHCDAKNMVANKYLKKYKETK